MADFAAIWEARKLLRASRAGTLATSAQGQPFASLVTPACAPDLSLLLLLSVCVFWLREADDLGIGS